MNVDVEAKQEFDLKDDVQLKPGIDLKDDSDAIPEVVSNDDIRVKIETESQKTQDNCGKGNVKDKLPDSNQFNPDITKQFTNNQVC